MKHTKGPWILKEHDSAWTIHSNDATEFDEAPYIADVHKHTNDELNELSSFNARLISASPELLDALKEALSCIDQHEDDKVLGPIIQYAKKTIAKAEGNNK